MGRSINSRPKRPIRSSKQRPALALTDEIFSILRLNAQHPVRVLVLTITPTVPRLPGPRRPA
ncbi:hypothetical protein JB92DRAFT_2904364 [Gautieria morchelliformis]|nr:hypothetical protein JB92DRAFT_2904364 [Gautieria morchelliformis]